LTLSETSSLGDCLSDGDIDLSDGGVELNSGGGVALPDDMSLYGQLTRYAGTTQSSTKPKRKSKKPKSKKTADTADPATGTKKSGKKSKKTANTETAGTGAEKPKKRKKNKNKQPVQDPYDTSDDGLNHEAAQGFYYEDYGASQDYYTGHQNYDPYDDCTAADPDADLGRSKPSQYSRKQLKQIATAVVAQYGAISEDLGTVLDKVRKLDISAFTAMADAFDQARPVSNDPSDDECHDSSGTEDDISHRGEATEIGDLKLIESGPHHCWSQTTSGGQ